MGVDQAGSDLTVSNEIVSAHTEPGLFRLIYMSQNMIVGDAAAIEAEIRHILASSRRNNRVAGITGALVFSSGSFLQTLEGPVDAIEALYERIATDARHGNPQILEACDVEKRQFGEWSMAFSGENTVEQSRFKALLELQNKAERVQAADELLAELRMETGTEAVAPQPCGFVPAREAA